MKFSFHFVDISSLHYNLFSYTINALKQEEKLHFDWTETDYSEYLLSLNFNFKWINAIIACIYRLVLLVFLFLLCVALAMTYLFHGADWIWVRAFTHSLRTHTQIAANAHIKRIYQPKISMFQFWFRYCKNKNQQQQQQLHKLQKSAKSRWISCAAPTEVKV